MATRTQHVFRISPRRAQFKRAPKLLRHRAQLLRRKSLLKEVRSRNKSVHRIIVGLVVSLYISIVLGIHPVPLKLQRIFFFRVFVKALQVGEQFKRSQTEDEPIRFCSHCSNQVKSTRAVFFHLSQLSRKRA